MTTYAERLESALAHLRTARRVAVLTGAGVSAASGIPTFRDPQAGAWRDLDPQTFLTTRHYRVDPDGVWAWHLDKARQALTAGPNGGHRALAALERQVLGRPDAAFTVATQNIDGLHQRAGSQDVLELHGTVHRARCERCEVTFSLPPLAELRRGAHCPACGHLARPAVVWYGDALDAEVLGDAERAFRAAEVTLVIGTSALVFPAANLPLLTRRAGGQVIEINPEVTDLTAHCALSLRCGTEEGLAQLGVTVDSAGSAPGGAA